MKGIWFTNFLAVDISVVPGVKSYQHGARHGRSISQLRSSNSDAGVGVFVELTFNGSCLPVQEHKIKANNDKYFNKRKIEVAFIILLNTYTHRSILRFDYFWFINS